VNIINYIHFQNGDIIASFRHKKHPAMLSLKVKPLPCLSSRLDCMWEGKGCSEDILKKYRFKHVLLADGKRLILYKPGLQWVGSEGISLDLSTEHGFEICCRAVARHTVDDDMIVEFIQSGVTFQGKLQDFSAVSFRALLSDQSSRLTQLVNTDEPVFVILRRGRETVYSGKSLLIRQSSGQEELHVVCRPLDEHIRRFKPKEFRSQRHRLFPQPNVVFRHPVIGRTIRLKVQDISGSGVSVIEDFSDSVLLPGLIIPEMDIELSNDFAIRTHAQIVYRGFSNDQEEKARVKHGIAFLDMELQDQARLANLLHQDANSETYVSSRVDIDSLMKFFFDAGFFYPQKYSFVHSNKEKLLETYEKLYLQNQNIARHFIYQDNNEIKGHISMVRSFERTWLFHHHVASRASSVKAGLIVLNQISRYVNDFYNFSSSHMDYVISFFRPENRFPSRVFGGFEKYLGELKECSMDTFAYLIFHKSIDGADVSGPPLEADKLKLEKATAEDLKELEYFYEYTSGGIMLDALDLKTHMFGNDSLDREYRKIGLRRERHLYSLKDNGTLKAVFMVQITDFGLNLSNLTNCIYVFIVDGDGLSMDGLNRGLTILMEHFYHDEIPVLMYPVNFAEDQNVSYDKRYNLWVISTRCTDQFLKYTENTFKRGKR
jgi:hypothetical protein